MPQRKIVCLLFTLMFVKKDWNMSVILSCLYWFFQIFTNADKAHASQVLSRLGLEDCFEGIICFETLNPPHEPVDCLDVPEDNAVLTGGTPEAEANSIGLTDCRSFISKSRILCKPSVEAFVAAIQIADVDPKKTVKFNAHLRIFLG